MVVLLGHDGHGFFVVAISNLGHQRCSKISIVSVHDVGVSSGGE
jgi:hypothetical protein